MLLRQGSELVARSGTPFAKEAGAALQNVVDRHATLTIVRSGSLLYEADLLSQVKEMFQDVLDQLNE